MLYLLSCKEHIKPEVQKEVPPKTTAKLQLDPLTPPDPYFTGSKSIHSTQGPKSITRNILQDKNGKIWFGTWEGIMRYDGPSKNGKQASFINLTNKLELRPFRSFTILEDSQGHIWFGTIGAGIYKYDGATFTNITTKDGLVNDRVVNLYEDRDGIIWICTTDGLSRYDGRSFQNFTTADGLTDNDVNSIIQDQAGSYWLGTRGAACVYDGKSFSKLTNDDESTFQNVRTIIEDSAGNIWLGGNDGLWQYNSSPILRPDKFINYSTDFVGYIYEDTDGNIWTSSASGGGNSGFWKISKYDSHSLESGIKTSTKILEEENMFFGITEDEEGGMWFGHLRGVCRYDGNLFDYFR